MGLLDPINPLSGLTGTPGVSELPGAESYVTGQGIQGGLNQLVDAISQRQNPLLTAGRVGLGFVGGQQQGMQNLANFQKLRQDLMKGGLDITKSGLDITQSQLNIGEKQFDLGRKVSQQQNLYNLIKNLSPDQKALALSNEEEFTKLMIGNMKPTTSIQEYEYAVANGYTGSYPDYVKEVEKYRASTVSFGQESSYAKEALKKGYQADEALVTKAYNMIDVAQETNAASNIIASGKANIGPFAPAEQAIQKARDAFFADGKFAESTSMTDVLSAITGKQVFPLISELNIGARGLDTPAERKFLQRVMTGDITMTPDALMKIQMMIRRRQEKFANAYNRKLESGQLNEYQKYRGNLEKLALPDAVPVAKFKRGERTYTVYNNGEAIFDDDKSTVTNFDPFSTVLIGGQ